MITITASWHNQVTETAVELVYVNILIGLVSTSMVQWHAIFYTYDTPLCKIDNLMGLEHSN